MERRDEQLEPNYVLGIAFHTVVSEKRVLELESELIHVA